MAKPNYQFEKRQRDLAKQRKQEDKRQQKLAAKAAAVTPSDTPVEPDGAATETGTSEVVPSPER